MEETKSDSVPRKSPMMYDQLPQEAKWLAQELLEVGDRFDKALRNMATIRQGFRRLPILRPRNGLLLLFESQIYVLAIFNAVARRHGFTEQALEDLNYTAAFETICKAYESVDEDGNLLDGCIQRIDQYIELLGFSGGQARDRLSNYMRQLYYHAEESDRIFLWELGKDAIIVADISTEIAFSDALARADGAVVTPFFHRRGGTMLSILSIASKAIATWRIERNLYNHGTDEAP
jgi:hypothetical protein